MGGAPGVSAAFETYQDRRLQRVRRAIAAANANARNYHLRHPIGRLAAHAALRVVGTIAPGLMLWRFNWLYRHDVTAAGRAGIKHASIAPPQPLERAGVEKPPVRTPRPKVPKAAPKGVKQPQSRLSLAKLRVKPSEPPLLLTEAVPKTDKGATPKKTRKPSKSRTAKAASKAGGTAPNSASSKTATPKATNKQSDPPKRVEAPKPSAVTAAVLKKTKPASPK